MGNETERAEDQQYGSHAKEDDAVVVEQRVGGVGGYQADDPANERRDHRIEDRDQAAEDEQRDRQAPDLTNIEPVEPRQPGIRRRGRRAGGGIKEGFEAAQHTHKRWTLQAATSIAPP